MATGSPVSFWYGTRAQFDSITTKLDTILYFITDEQALYKGSVKFSGSGVDTLLTISSTQPSASSVTTGDKYFDTSDNLIHVLKNESGTVTTTATYEPANGALYYNADAQRFQTLIKNGSSYVPTEIYDAGISVEDGTGLVLNGTTVGGLDATTNSKGVVQVGTNISVSNGVISVPVATNAVFGVVKSGDNITNNNGVLSVAKATASSLGVVKVGSNINVDNNGQISVPVANGDTRGVIKIASPFSCDADGILDIGYASATNKGVVKVGTNIDVADGVISVKNASTDEYGVVYTASSIRSVDDGEAVSTAENYVPTVGAVESALFTKQNNLSNGNVTTINTTSGAKIDVNVGDGLDVGVAGSTNANKLIVNEASVKEVLEDVVDGGTEPAVNEIVTADNLRGALSVGQAVDVSCDLNLYGPNPSQCYNGENFLDGFWVPRTLANKATTAMGYNPFPKFVSGLKYLAIADVRNISNVKIDWLYFGYYSGDTFFEAQAVDGVPVSSGALPANESLDPVENPYVRIAGIFTGSYMGLRQRQSTGSTASFTFEVRNWRVYEVTALTDEAIAYIAQLPEPDAFFRSTDAYSILAKYLIKQDMVCPWIPTINMPDNSDLTVGAGLSYKIKYTNDNTHTITADTIPTDAYGWDTHIQMFIKGTSAINFQKPLVLMDALTPNAGHNLSVKWRNGDALVYVDDLNAGNIVISTSGTTAGTLNYFLQQDPGSGQDNYIIFAETTDNATCDAGTVTVNYNTDILGNGTDKTTITGTYNVASGKTMNLQSLTVTGSTINGAGTCSISNTVVSGVFVAESGSTVAFSGVNTLNAEFSGLGTTKFLKGSTVSGTGTFELTGKNTALIADGDSTINVLLDGVTITGGTYANGTIADVSNNNTVVSLNNCVITGNTAANYLIRARGDATTNINNCVFTDDNSGSLWNRNKNLHVSGSTFSTAISCFGMTLSGTNKFGDLVSYNTEDIIVAPDTVIDLTGNTHATNNRIIYNTSTMDAPGYIKFGDNVTIISKDGDIRKYDAIMFKNVWQNAGVVLGLKITGSTVNPWKADNAWFRDPLDASEASTVQFTDTTFTGSSLISKEPMRIQLPAGTTVSFSGNTNVENTKILDAGLIVVGDNPASPSGSATIVNASGASSTVTGIGTYIDKEGDNDFVANNTTNVVAVDDSTTGAKYLGTVLSATTGDTGANRFAKIDSGAVAVVNEATNAVNKQIITHDYEPIIGGTFSLTSTTVDESMKTVAIQSGGVMTLGDAYIPSGSTVAVSGGGLAVEKVSGNGGVIDLGYNSATQTGGTRINVYRQGTAYVANCIVKNAKQTDEVNYGAFNVESSTLILSGTTISDCVASAYAGVRAYLESSLLELHDCLVTSNTGFANNTNNLQFIGIGAQYGATVKLYGSTVTGSIPSGTSTDAADIFIVGSATNFEAHGDNIIGKVRLQNGNLKIVDGTTKIESYVLGQNAAVSGTVTISSGATLDLTGNSEPTPIAPGGGITFASGGATVLYGEVGSASSMFIDNANITKGSIASGGVIELGGGNISNGSFDGVIFKTTVSRSLAYGNILFHNCTLGSTGEPSPYTLVVQDNAHITISGTFVLDRQGLASNTGGGSTPNTFNVTIADGAVLDCTNHYSLFWGDNALVATGTLELGSNVKIIYPAGTTVYANGGTAGTFQNSNLKLDGTIEPRT